MPGLPKIYLIPSVFVLFVLSSVTLDHHKNIQDSFCEATVAGVHLDSTDQTQTLVLFCEKEKIYLFIGIATQEAIAIQLEMSGLKAPRPLTADLLKTMLDELGATVVRCVITRVENETFYAEIQLKDRDGKVVTIDARPSDAIGLSLRFRTSIGIARKVLQEYGVSNAFPRPSKNRKS